MSFIPAAPPFGDCDYAKALGIHSRVHTQNTEVLFLALRSNVGSRFRYDFRHLLIP